MKHGVRSGLEARVGQQITAAGLAYDYETLKLKFVQPSKPRTYTPDFVMVKRTGGLLVIETKGRFETKDRQKHIMVKQQHPEIDIRFVFSRSAATISKASKTTYAMWCVKNGFQFADKLIPKEWLDECQA